MTRRKTTEQFKKELAIANPTVEVLGEYTAGKKPIKVRCKKHDVVWEPSAASVLRGSGCNMCKREKITGRPATYTDKYLKKFLSNKYKGKYTFIQRIKGKETVLDRVELKCNTCGNIGIYLVYNIVAKDRKSFGCYTCWKKSICKTKEQFEKDLYDSWKGLYTLVGDYLGAKCKNTFKCNTCGNIFEAKAGDVLSHNWGCNVCNHSLGEFFIESYLKNKDMLYEIPKKFDNLKDKKKLHYDFYLPDRNVLIEYQGLQHYQPIKYYGGEKRFKVQQLHDKMKREYAINNGYRLLEVTYEENTQEKVNSYLDKNL